jgi:hypothetical protein
MKKRVFKLKTFARWSKKLLSDGQLCKAAQEILEGHFEADSGKGLCKKRIAVSGHGKRGSFRTLVAKDSALAIFYMAGRQKNEPGSDFSEANVAQARLLGQALQVVDSSKLDQLVAVGA